MSFFKTQEFPHGPSLPLSKTFVKASWQCLSLDLIMQSGLECVLWLHTVARPLHTEVHSWPRMAHQKFSALPLFVSAEVWHYQVCYSTYKYLHKAVMSCEQGKGHSPDSRTPAKCCVSVQRHIKDKNTFTITVTSRSKQIQFAQHIWGKELPDAQEQQ